MGYGDWTQIQINNDTSGPLVIANAKLEWGKFYSCTPSANKDAEISPGALNGTTIPAKAAFTIGSCGRENTWSGCEGSFSLVSGVNTACTINFYSPHGASYNSFSVNNPNTGKFIGGATGGHMGNDDPLGQVYVTVTQIGAA